MTAPRPAAGAPGGSARGDPPPRWALNPYRIAELLLAQPLAVRDRAVGEALADAFRTKLELLFAPDPQSPTLLDLLRDPRIVASAFPSVEAALAALRAIGGPAIAGFADGQLARLAPWLLPVDAGLPAPPGAARPAQPDRRAVHGDRYVDALSFLDPRQGATADCYLIAAMIAIAWTWPERWQARIAATRPQAGAERWFRWTFAGQSTAARDVIELDADVWVATDGEPVYASSLDGGEQWPGLAEKAYAMWRNGVASRRDPSPGSYIRLGADLAQWPEEAGKVLLAAGREGRKRQLPGTPLSTQIAAQLDGNSICGALVASTWDEKNLAKRLRSEQQVVREDAKAAHELFRTAGVALQQNHAYAVLGLHESDGRQYVVLRDPHAEDPARRHCAAGAWRPRSSRHGVAEVALGKHGVFALERELFDRMFYWLSSIDIDD